MPNHRAANLSARNLERVKATTEGGGCRDRPEHLKLECHKVFPNIAMSMAGCRGTSPASVLTTKCTSYSNRRFGHPEQDRAISIREVACLQTLPENFVFKGCMVSMARQVGNVVPVRLAKLVGQQLIDHLKDVGRLS